MTSELKLALTVSIGVHAAVLVGLPLTEPVAFDVERASTSVELYLVAPQAPAVSAAPEPIAPPPEPTPTSALEPPEPAAQTAVVPEERGAQVDLLPGYLRNPPPVYPKLARERGYEGSVLLEVEVLPSGRCGAIRVLASSGYPVLDDAAARAVRAWVFRPARRWHLPVPFQVEIPITFRLIDG